MPRHLKSEHPPDQAVPKQGSTGIFDGQGFVAIEPMRNGGLISESRGWVALLAITAGDGWRLGSGWVGRRVETADWSMRALFEPVMMVRPPVREGCVPDARKLRARHICLRFGPAVSLLSGSDRLEARAGDNPSEMGRWAASTRPEHNHQEGTESHDDGNRNSGRFL